MSKRFIHVMAGVIVNASGEILIAKRPDTAHQGGLWEFPGGKRELGESPAEALARELDEELGIQVRACRPQIQIAHDYGDKQVFLDVWRVTAFEGEAHGREGQPVRWVRPDELGGYAFPAANRPIVSAARLPDCYLITPDPDAGDLSGFLARLERALSMGQRLVQLRAKGLSESALDELAGDVAARCRAAGAEWLLNGPAALAYRHGADGLHLDGAALATLDERPEGLRWLAASCHDAAQLSRAEALGCDFAVLSPVKATASHPRILPLGWAGFAERVRGVGMPVYGLGGLSPADRDDAWAAGAQGIAGIRGLWPD
ncbi:MAG: Nudix family hydrolase [Gammaproteobacteria bacterium]|nr:Nudix family hydrolase [Gammaproteobacteria bacterium]